MPLSDLRVLGRSGVKVSPLTLGTLNFGKEGATDHDEARAIFERAIEAGINVVDTADVYSQGAAETVVGALLRGRREEVFLATKFHGQIGADLRHAGNSRKWIRTAVEQSLRRLDTEYIDLYQVHRPDPDTDLLETLFALNDLIRQGKILYYGTSVFPVDQVIEAQYLAKEHGLQPPLTEQLPYSLLIRTNERTVLPVARKHRLGVLSYGPLASGWLSGAYRVGAEQPASSREGGRIPHRYDIAHEQNAAKLRAADALAQLADRVGVSLPELAVAFALNHPAISTVIAGPRTSGHLESYLRAAELVLDDEVLDEIDRIAAPGTHFVELDLGAREDTLEPARLRRGRTA